MFYTRLSLLNFAKIPKYMSLIATVRKFYGDWCWMVIFYFPTLFLFLIMMQYFLILYEPDGCSLRPNLHPFFFGWIAHEVIEVLCTSHERSRLELSNKASCSSSVGEKTNSEFTSHFIVVIICIQLCAPITLVWITHEPVIV